MPRLAKQFTVIAIDLRGVGGSAIAPDGYDAATMAGDVYQLALTLELQGVYVVGHDIGGMVTYAFVRLYPHITRGCDDPGCGHPGIDGWDEVKAMPSFGTSRLCRFRKYQKDLSSAGKTTFSLIFTTSPNSRQKI
jgi:pimeloyl-ACP methyl ester carboxylesterase